MTVEFLVRFDGDDMVCESKTDGSFTEIVRQPNECECEVDTCTDQIERMQMVAESVYGGWLPWTYFPDDKDLICRTGLVN